MAATDTPRTSLTWDYAPAPESADHVRLRDRYDLFVADVAFGGERDIAAAVAAARAAQPGWAALSGLERGKYVFRIARLIQERARELSVVESLDGGKPIRES